MGIRDWLWRGLQWGVPVFLMCSMYQLATSQLFVHAGAAEEATGQSECDNDEAESKSENDGVSLMRTFPPFVVAMD